MYKTLLAALGAAAAHAFDGHVSPVDVDVSTKELGIVMWQPFY